MSTQTKTYKGCTYKIIAIGNKFYAEVFCPGRTHCTKPRRSAPTAENDAENFIDKRVRA